MAGSGTVSRRTALTASAALVLSAGAEACAAEAPMGRVLVAYFSRSGNTRVIAGQLHRELKADLFEIVAARPYPEDYEEQVAQATREREAGSLPPLKARASNVAAYETVLLCFPIWGQTAPQIVRSFLSSHDLAGKAIRPIITHGGYGPGDAVEVLKADAPRSRVLAPFVMEADQERRTMTTVRAWMAQMQRA